MVIYGRNPVRESLRGRRRGSVRDVWASERLAGERWLAGLSVKVASNAEIAQRCESEAHQGICAEAGEFPYVSHAQLLAIEAPLLVVLDDVEDPQNLGAICRTAECAGADGVVIHARHAAEVTPAACKASAGAVEHIAVAKARNIADFLRDARASGCWCYGANMPASSVEASVPASTLDASGRTVGSVKRHGATPVSYDAPDYRGGVVLVLGGEGRGLRPRVAASCDQLIALPLHGRVGSLGVSAAAAAILYRVVRDRPPQPATDRPPASAPNPPKNRYSSP